MRTQSRVFRIILPVIIILAALLVTWAAVKFRKGPEKIAARNPGILVDVIPVMPASTAVTVFATGTVEPRRQIEIIPQVSGRVESISPRLVGGGFFSAGEVLLTIESIDYRLAVQQAQANLARAELELVTVESQARVAREEWNRLYPDDTTPPNPLAVYEPQLNKEKANVLSARSALQQAELNLSRTVIRAPFNCRIRSESADLGQFLKSGAPIAVIAGTDAAEIIVPLPLEDLQWLNIPRMGSKSPGSSATIRVQGDGSHTWQGTVVRSLGELDTRGRMARVAIRVDDPYQLQKEGVSIERHLTTGLFVNVELQGHNLEDVFVIPRHALRDNSTVWLADSDNRLKIQPVHVLRREQSSLIIDQGLKDGDRLVTTSLAGSADGLLLRPRMAGESK